MSSQSDTRNRIDVERRRLLRAVPLAGLVAVGSGTATAAAREGVAGTATPAAGPSTAFPDVIPLPVGFRPEGIVAGRGHEFFVGSLAAGAIYRGNLRTGEGELLVPDAEGKVAVGLSYDGRSDRLFVAGGDTGEAYVYDAGTGEEVGSYTFAGAGFVNDVVVTRTAAYFTDSFRTVLYRLPLGPAGRLPDASGVEEVPLGGDFQFVGGEFNANGIDAPPDGAYLLVVNTFTGRLYRVDPSSGQATLVDLGGEDLTTGDGILLDGMTLYVVRNFLNQVAVVELDPGATGGEVVREITDSEFRVPTTVAEFGRGLYAVNARFDLPESEQGDAEYEVVRVSK
jgi:hypothetical protein